MMGFKDSLIGMVGDFVELKRNPEFRSKTDISSAQSTSASALFNVANRRHSLNITVGTVEATPEEAIRQRTFSISAEAGKLRDKWNSSDSTSLKVEPWLGEEKARYAGKGRRASEPVNFVPVNWNTARAKPSRNLFSKPKRTHLASNSSLDESSIGNKSPPRISLAPPEQMDNLGCEDDSPPKSPCTPLFKNSYIKFHSSPIEEDWEAEKIAAGIENTVKIDGKKRFVAENTVTRF